MMKIRQCGEYLSKNIFSYIIIPMIFVVIIFSYYRFMVSHNYIVGYHGRCDSSTGKCFMSCEDDACDKVDYYSEMQKNEPDLYRECGEDITNCELANECLPSDHNCSITYCDDKTSNKDNPCQVPNVGEKSDNQNINQIQSTNNIKI